MDRVVGIVDARVKSSTDDVFDIESECLEEPLPQRLDRCVVNTLHLEHRRKFFCINIGCIRFTGNESFSEDCLDSCSSLSLPQACLTSINDSCLAPLVGDKCDWNH